jgi:hypothetical protein
MSLAADYQRRATEFRATDREQPDHVLIPDPEYHAAPHYSSSN